MRDHLAHVYVMRRGDGLVKIGISRSLALREKTLSTKNLPCRLIWATERRCDARDIEFTAHSSALTSHIGGEWFSVSSDEAIAIVSNAIDRVSSGDLSGRKRLPGASIRHAPPKGDPLLVRMQHEVKSALERAALADQRSLSSLIAKIATDWSRSNGWLKEPKERDGPCARSQVVR